MTLRTTSLALALLLGPAVAQAATNGPLQRSTSKPTGFVDRDGNAVWLTGYTVCCLSPDAKQDGWPWISTAWLDTIAGYGANYAHIRLGPFTRWGEESDNFTPYLFSPESGEQGLYDLNDWNPVYWTNLRALLAHARMRGIYVEVDLIDGYLIGTTDIENADEPCIVDADPDKDPAECLSPWRRSANLNGYDGGRCELMGNAPEPNSHADRFLRKIVTEIGEFDNVIFQVGNENFKCSARVAWEAGVIAIVAQEMASQGRQPHLISTNSHNEAAEALEEVDYVNRHFNHGAVDLREGKPTGVNEYNNASFDADRYTKEVWSAFTAKGTYFHYFRGPNTDAQVDATLARMAIFIDVIGGTNFGLFNATPLGPNHVGRPGREYVGFLDIGGSITINLGPTVRTFAFSWINPRNGNTAASGQITASGNHPFNAPSANMWVLHVTRANCTAPVEAPVLLEPIGTITDTTPTFSWTAVPDADVYTLFARKVLGEEQVLHIYNIAGTSFTPSNPLPTDGPIEWKVKGEACQPVQGGPYSPYATFEIDDAPAPSVSIADATVSEGQAGITNLDFTVFLPHAAAVDVSVDVTTVGGGTATPAPLPGADYEPLSTRVTIPAGSTSRTATVRALGDTGNEADETVLVALSNPTGAPIGDGHAQGTIANDDPLPSLSINGPTLAEGDDGTVAAVFTVTLSAASGREVSVGYASADGSASAPGDYLTASGQITFAAGDTARDLAVQVVGDETAEADETFFVDLGAPVNATIATGHGVGTILNDESPWKNVGTGDFNGDGSVDILWRHDSGQLKVWFMDGIAFLSETPTVPSGIADLNWRVRGTGDFNGDGNVDILWRHETAGQVVVWFMDGTTQKGGTFTTPPAVADLNWRIRGTGDFNGDGQVDILWRHEGSGQLVVWEMDGTTLVTGTFTQPSNPPDVNWIATSTGDFNGDGRVDILWRHRLSGEVVAWFMEGTVLSGGAFTTPSSVADLRWKLVGTGDFNRDGAVDILWRHNASGQNVAWLMDGVVLLPGGGVFLAPFY